MPHLGFNEVGEHPDVLEQVLDCGIAWVLAFGSDRRIIVAKNDGLPWKFWDLVKSTDPTLVRVLDVNPRIAQAMALQKLEELADKSTVVIVRVRDLGDGDFGYQLLIPEVH